MTNRQKHRGQHPNDPKLFNDKTLPTLQHATHDLSILLEMGYPEKASLKLIGDRFRLRERQRKAILRAACPNSEYLLRKSKEIPVQQLKGKTVYIDGFNAIIALESALSKGILFLGKDGCYRDQASIHGSYKKVLETESAILILGRAIEQLRIKQAYWYLDKPVSNSGRLKTHLFELALQNNWNWEVALDVNPDKVLIECGEIVITSDSMILNEASNWTNLIRWSVDNFTPESIILDLASF